MTKSEGYNKGDIYESKIHQLLIRKKILNKNSDRAGASDRADIEINYNNKKIKIEVKADENADYGQKSIKCSSDIGWKWAKSDKVTDFYNEIKIIDNYIDKKFIPRKFIKERFKITQLDKTFDQKNFERPNIKIPLSTLFDYYKLKGVYYIQLENSGFYHLSEDKLNLNTQQFDGIIVLRLRAKTIHSKDSDGNLTPWNYNFYGVLKMSKKPTPSKLDIEEKEQRHFPFKK